MRASRPTALRPLVQSQGLSSTLLRMQGGISPAPNTAQAHHQDCLWRSKGQASHSDFGVALMSNDFSVRIKRSGTFADPGGARLLPPRSPRTLRKYIHTCTLRIIRPGGSQGWGGGSPPQDARRCSGTRNTHRLVYCSPEHPCVRFDRLARESARSGHSLDT